MVVVTGALLALSQVVRANADATPVVAVLASSSLAVSVLALRANARARVRVIQEGARSARETIVRSSLACLAVIGALNADIADRAGDESHGLAACHTPLLVADEVGVSCALGAVGAEGSCANQAELVAELAFLLVKVVVVVAAEGVADRVVRAVRNTGGLEEVRVHLRVAGGTDDVADASQALKRACIARFLGYILVGVVGAGVRTRVVGNDQIVSRIALCALVFGRA